MKYKEKQIRTFTKLGTTPFEWEHEGLINTVDEPVSCELCDHYPIKHQYLLEHKDGKELLVGSECVKNYMELVHDTNYKTLIDKIAYDEWKNWVSVFFREYKDRSYMLRTEIADKRLARAVYKLNDDYKSGELSLFLADSEVLGKDMRRIYKRAWKLYYTIPRSIKHIFQLK